MASEISKLKALYQQLDRQQDAGEDVVAELKKEINNLELAYLKEQVLPQVAQYMASKVCYLRCSIDCNLQFDGKEEINYTFCSSGSMLFIKDRLSLKSLLETQTWQYVDYRPNKTPIRKLDKTPDSKDLIVNIIDYHENDIAVFCDTKELSKDFALLGGYFNSRLRNGAGWIFPKKKFPELTNFLKSKNITIKVEEKTIEVAQQKIETNLDVKGQNFIDLIMAMRCMSFKGLSSPHKAIFLLMVMDGIENGYITENKFVPSFKLSNYFIKIWKEYIPSSNSFQSNVFQPFMHLDSEPFYTTIKIPGIPHFDINQAWNLKSVKKYVIFGKFDEALFIFFHDKSFREKLKEKIIAKFLNFKKSNKSFSENSISRKEGMRTKPLLPFRKYLSTRKSMIGRHYTSSTINTYVSSLYNEYIKEKICKFAETDNIEKIKDISTIDRIIESVESDVNVGNGNTVTLTTLKLYKEFLIKEISQEDASPSISKGAITKNKNTIIGNSKILKK